MRPLAVIVPAALAIALAVFVQLFGASLSGPQIDSQPMAMSAEKPAEIFAGSLPVVHALGRRAAQSQSNDCANGQCKGRKCDFRRPIDVEVDNSTTITAPEGSSPASPAKPPASADAKRPGESADAKVGLTLAIFALVCGVGVVIGFKRRAGAKAKN